MSSLFSIIMAFSLLSILFTFSLYLFLSESLIKSRNVFDSCLIALLIKYYIHSKKVNINDKKIHISIEY